VPFLKVGWNRQFLMMKEFGFIYDSSMVAPAFTNPPLWPYTLDYKIPHECVGNNNCPSRSYPGEDDLINEDKMLLKLRKFMSFRCMGNGHESTRN
jgi:hypothetical protein